MYGIRQKNGSEFMRKGEVGDHRNHFQSRSELERNFDAWIQKGIEGTDLVFDYGTVEAESSSLDELVKDEK